MSQLASGSNQEVLSPGTTAAEHVVILGGGFGGWYAARHLAGILPLEHKITLVDRVDHMLYTPMLTEVARGRLVPQPLPQESSHKARHPAEYCVSLPSTPTQLPYINSTTIIGTQKDLRASNRERRPTLKFPNGVVS